MLNGNIQKGGAMLGDTRRIVEAWDDSADADTNLERITATNALGKKSRKRSDDVLLRILRPRFVDPNPDVVPSLRALLDSPRSFSEACFYETARDDQLLAAFAEGPIFDWYSAGRVGVTVEETKAWLEALAQDGRLPQWTDTVRTKVARGLLAALRDFGVLRGAVIKEFASPGMSARGFAYVSFREHQQGVSARAMVEGTLWRRWLLDDRWVNDLLTQVDHLGLLHYSKAGSSVRLDWRVDDLVDAVCAAA